MFSDAAEVNCKHFAFFLVIKQIVLENMILEIHSVAIGEHFHPLSDISYQNYFQCRQCSIDFGWQFSYIWGHQIFIGKAKTFRKFQFCSDKSEMFYLLCRQNILLWCRMFSGINYDRACPSDHVCVKIGIPWKFDWRWCEKEFASSQGIVVTSQIRYLSTSEMPLSAWKYVMPTSCW